MHVRYGLSYDQWINDGLPDGLSPSTGVGMPGGSLDWTSDGVQYYWDAQAGEFVA